MKILMDKGVKFGKVTSEMMSIMQNKTKPMMQEAINSIGGSAASIVAAYKKERGN